MKFEKNIKINLNQELYEGMKKCVHKASPNEACGLVFGDIEKIDIENRSQIHYIGKKFNCFESDRKSSVAFLIENFEELNKVLLTANEYGLRLISIFHSHPSGAHPSGVDRNHMIYLDDFIIKIFKNQIWTIMDASNNELNGFIYFNKEFLQVDLKIL